MGKITAINPQRRDGRFNVMVDNAFAFAVSEKVLVDQQFSIGQEISSDALAAAGQAEDTHKALTAALRLLEVRERSENEIVSRLKQREYDDLIISSVLTKLKAWDLLDDGHFSKSWVESRSRLLPAGKHRLRSELIQKGIARETIDEAVEAISEGDEIDLARRALQKRSASLPTEHDARQAAYVRDAGYLARRGFGWTVARTVLKERYGVTQEIDGE